MAKYTITSKLGMTPYAEANTLKEAKRLSAEAKRQGLDGEIVKNRMSCRETDEFLAAWK